MLLLYYRNVVEHILVSVSCIFVDNAFLEFEPTSLVVGTHGHHHVTVRILIMIDISHVSFTRLSCWQRLLSRLVGGKLLETQKFLLGCRLVAKVVLIFKLRKLLLVLKCLYLLLLSYLLLLQ